MSVISLPTTTCVRPTRFESLVLRGIAAAGALVARRMSRRATRQGLRDAQDAALERRRDAAAAHALGLYPR